VNTYPQTLHKSNVLAHKYSPHRYPMASGSRQHRRCLAIAQHSLLSLTTRFLFNAIAPFAPAPLDNVHIHSVCVCFAFSPGALPVHEKELELLLVRSDGPEIERDLRNGFQAMPSRGVIESQHHTNPSSTSYSSTQSTGTVAVRETTGEGVTHSARQRRAFRDVIQAPQGQYARIPEATDYNV